MVVEAEEVEEAVADAAAEVLVEVEGGDSAAAVGAVARRPT